MFHQTSTSGSHDNLSLDNIVSYSQGNNSKENGSFLELMESMGSPAVKISSQISMTEDNIDAGKHKGSEIRKNNNKGRYAFQTRSQVDILDDGYRWRKYGQKSVKNSKFPRSYYRCTNGGCKVKKQVQRLSKDEGVVVTTYEGMHSHPIEKSSDNFEHILTQMQIYPTS